MNPVYIYSGILALLTIGVAVWLRVTPLMDGFDLGKIARRLPKEVRTRLQTPAQPSKPSAPSYPRLMDPSHYRKDTK